MIVEPASLHSRSPLRRLLRAGAFVVPVVLLVMAVAAGLLGSKPSSEQRLAQASADALGSPDPTAPPNPSSDPAPTPPLTSDDMAFPAAFLSIAALRPSEVLALRESPQGPRGVLAVVGYFELVGAINQCAAPMATGGSWCDRLGTLSDRPWDGEGAPPPHLHVTVAAGVVLPPGLVPPDGSSPREWMPVEVLGRFDTTGTCGGDERACEHGFVVERVVWLDGETESLAPLQQLAQDASTRGAPDRLPGVSGPMLMAVFASARTIAALDAAAGAAAMRQGSARGGMWYIRELTGIAGAAPTERWVLFDASGRRRLATGPSASPPVVKGLAPSAGPAY